MDKKRKNISHLDAAKPETNEKPNPNVEKLKKDFQEVSLYQAKRANLLLGEFSADGKYSLTDEKLLQDLVSMPKVLQERVDNVVYAHTKYKGLNVNFKVELDISESYCSAEMFLIEIENTPDEDIKHLTSLGNFVEMYSPRFKENVYKTWNINLQETPLDKDSAVFRTLRDLDGEYNFNKELIEILSQLYIVRLLKLLEGCGTLGLKIQGDYRVLVEQLIRKDPSLAQDHTRLKQLLDKMIAKHNGFDVIASMPGGAEIMKNYAEPIDRVRGKLAPVLVEAKENKEEKTASAPAKKEEQKKKKKAKSKGGDSVKPFVYAIKNYNPQVLTSVEEAKKFAPSPSINPTATVAVGNAAQPKRNEVEQKNEPPKHTERKRAYDPDAIRRELQEMANANTNKLNRESLDNGNLAISRDELDSVSLLDDGLVPELLDEGASEYGDLSAEDSLVAESLSDELGTDELQIRELGN